MDTTGYIRWIQLDIKLVSDFRSREKNELSYFTIEDSVLILHIELLAYMVSF